MSDFQFNLYQQRRKRLAAHLQAMGGGTALILSADEKVRSQDTHYPFRQDSYFRYLTGFLESNAALLMTVKPEGVHQLLFCQPFDEEKAIWEGAHLGLDRAKIELGMDETLSIEQFDQELPKRLVGQKQLFFVWDAKVNDRVMKAVMRTQMSSRAGVYAPLALLDLSMVLDEMRLVKGLEEVETIRKAADISAQAHIQAMQYISQCIKRGKSVYEYQVEAEMLRVFRQMGADDAAYGSIVAGGANACVLHHRAGKAELKSGDLCLIDAACEFEGYAADITRTFPINGRFTAEQKAVYEIVLAAQRAAVEATRPEASFDAGHQAAVNVLAQGLLDLKLVKGTLAEVLEKKSYSRFYMHRTGHWLGMDVHDVGDYRVPIRWDVWKGDRTESVVRPLKEGMMLTIEPGLYIRPAEDVPKGFWNIGIRIEDDALVTKQGCELLTRGVPVSVDEIEDLMR
jgi:Xaa-Pro aminopeptidase